MTNNSNNPIKILLVDDDEDDYVLIKYLFDEFTSTDYQLEWTSSYDVGLKSAQENLHDIYLVDFRLGIKDGLQFLFQAIGYGCIAPIILLTGQGDQEVDMQAMDAGAADYLVKGQFDAPLLERSIRYSLRHARSITKMQNSEMRFRSVIQSASDAIFLVDSRGEITLWNTAAESIFGYTEAEIIGQNAVVLMAKKYAEKAIKTGVADTMALVMPMSGKIIEASGRRKNGSEFPLEMSGSVWKTSEGIFYTGIIRDITKRRNVETQLLLEATHDSLTGLPNRSLFTEFLNKAISDEPEASQFAVFFLDLDRFKVINDGLGHLAGDKLLKNIAERLRNSVRDGDKVARFGGDEFTILAKISSTEEVILLANRLQTELSKPVTFDGQEVFTSASIGITLSDGGKRRPQDLLRDADTAMYQAKANGKARFEIFEHDMNENSFNLLQKENDLRRALERKEFRVFYQPIYNLQTQEIVEFEALIRWIHPEKGIVSPTDFIPIAEETGLIIPIGRWVLEESCRQMAHWQKQFPRFSELGISVNLSTKQLMQPHLAKDVYQILSETGLRAESLKLEVTESSVMQNADTALKIMKDFEALGVRISSDDFGTGYSSLSYLNRFPFDNLKIDRSFIGRIDEDSKSEEIVRAILRLAENLNLEVVAEGIETETQLQRLIEFGCTFGQGFYFSEPIPSKNVEKMLTENSKETLFPFAFSKQPVFSSTEIQ
jgi:diguanylate cyclase (GGDEF)-like protein/PAS domain S-box-containing protein